MEIVPSRGHETGFQVTGADGGTSYPLLFPVEWNAHVTAGRRPCSCSQDHPKRSGPSRLADTCLWPCESKLSRVSSYRDTHPPMTLSDPHHLPKPHPQIPPQWGVRLQHQGLGGHKRSVHDTRQSLWAGTRRSHTGGLYLWGPLSSSYSSELGTGIAPFYR